MENQANSQKKFSTKGLLIVILIALVLGLIAFFLLKPGVEEPIFSQIADKVRPEAATDVIDFNKITGQGEKDQDLSDLMEERKAKYGVNESLDGIVKSGESIRVGEHTVPMEEILEDVRISRGEIVENELDAQTQEEPTPGAEKLATTSPASADEFGIYVVGPGDNIWNIHFSVLKEFFDRERVHLSPLADEPDSKGYSSGVGRILKFSENMVAIYNLETRKVDQNLNLIVPMTKIVIYNMTHVFDLLSQIDYSQVNLIQFDGDTLWLPTQQ